MCSLNHKIMTHFLSKPFPRLKRFFDVPRPLEETYSYGPG